MFKDQDEIFRQAAKDSFDRIILQIDERLKTLAPAPLSRFNEISADSLKKGAGRESWQLLLNGIHHLKNEGTIAGALSRTSLRASILAGAIGIRPPQFEQLPFAIDRMQGSEAAVFLCKRLAEAAEDDLLKSRKIISYQIALDDPSQIFGDKPDENNVNAMKRQMVFSFNVLAETYGKVCVEFKSMLDGMTPAARPRPPRPGF